MEDQRPRCCSQTEARFKKQLALLSQRNSLLQAELDELRLREENARHINQSLAEIYRSEGQSDKEAQSQSLRSQVQQLAKENSDLIQSLKCSTQEIQSLRLEKQETELQFERRLLQAKRQLQARFLQAGDEERASLTHRNEELAGRLTRAENTIRQYRRYLERVEDTECRAAVQNLNYSYFFDESHKKNLILSKIDLTRSVSARPEPPRESLCLERESYAKPRQRHSQLAHREEPVLSVRENRESAASYIKLSKLTEDKGSKRKGSSRKDSGRKPSLRLKENGEDSIDQLTDRISKVVSNLERACDRGRASGHRLLMGEKPPRF